MPFANPALNERVFSKEMDDGGQTGWAAPGGSATSGTATVTDPGTAAPLAPQPVERSSVPPFETTTGRVMTAGGTFTATLVLFVLLLAGAWVGWQQVHVTATTATTVSGTTQTSYNINIPGWIWIAMFGALGLAFLTIFKPKLARLTAPIYAVGEGVVLGAISAAYNLQFNGIVLQAVLATLSVFAVMLFLYTSRIIKVTERFRRIVIFSMLGIVVLYGVSIIASLFGASVPFLDQPSLLGIGLSIVIVIVASMNLMLNFDFIERAVRAGAPKYMEWYGAFGLMIALVWLYLEILRLLALLNRR
jgi:uncharacterized YccA/Bax inhibitor family protein